MIINLIIHAAAVNVTTSVVPAIIVLLLMVIIILMVVGFVIVILNRRKKGANSAYPSWPNPMYYDNQGIVDTITLKLISAIKY